MLGLRATQTLRFAMLSTYLVQNVLARVRKLNLFLKYVTHFVQLLTVSPIIKGSSHTDFISIGMGPAKKVCQ
jgi:hypothetical protein